MAVVHADAICGRDMRWMHNIADNNSTVTLRPTMQMPLSVMRVYCIGTYREMYCIIYDLPVAFYLAN